MMIVDSGPQEEYQPIASRTVSLGPIMYENNVQTGASLASLVELEQ